MKTLIALLIISLVSIPANAGGFSTIKKLKVQQPTAAESVSAISASDKSNTPPPRQTLRSRLPKLKPRS